MRKFAASLAAFVAVLAWQTASAQVTQPQAADAMKRLAFLRGDWNCVYQGGPESGQSEHINYSFTPDGRWMIERSDMRGSADSSGVQVWGYDPAQQKLVAHQYTTNGIFTKTVAGWQGNQFVSTRDDNHWQIVLRQDGANAITWIVHPTAVDATPVTEACKR